MLLSQYEIVKDLTEHTEREFKNDTVSMVPRFHVVHLCLTSRTVVSRMNGLFAF